MQNNRIIAAIKTSLLCLLLLMAPLSLPSMADDSPPPDGLQVFFSANVQGETEACG
ncbi:MAG: hypothetical protein ABFR63_03085 [Thermodesulfobacteriota bacterium]